MTVIQSGDWSGDPNSFSQEIGFNGTLWEFSGEIEWNGALMVKK